MCKSVEEKKFRKQNSENKARNKLFLFCLVRSFYPKFLRVFSFLSFFFLRFAKDQFLLLSRSLSTGRRLIF